MTKQRYLPAFAAAALLMSSAGAMAVVGEHDEQRTDPAEAYEQQQDRTAEQDRTGQRDDRTSQQDDRTAQQDDPWQQEEDAWRDDPADQQVGADDQDRQQERQMGAADDQQRQAAGNGGGIEQLEQLAQQHGNLSTFVEAIREAGMADALVGTTQYTIFAPTDEAFEQSERSREELLSPENRDDLIALLRGHIVADDVDPQMARTIRQAMTLDGGTINLETEEDQLRVGQATVVDGDVQAGNLRIYAIDQLVAPAGEFAAFEPRQEMDRDPMADDDDDLQRDDMDMDMDTDDDDDWGVQRDTNDDW